MPIRRIESVALPYAGKRHTPNTGALAALYTRGGDALAEISLRKGAASAQLFERLGQICTGYQQMEREKQSTAAALEMRAREKAEEREFATEQARLEREARTSERQTDAGIRATERDEAQAIRRGEREADATLAATTEERRQLERTVDRTRPGVVSPSLFEQVKRLSPQMATQFQVLDGAPVLMQTPEQARQAALDAAAATERQTDNTRADRQLAVAQQRANTAAAAATSLVPDTPDPPTDPNTPSILGQTGLSYNGFLALTGRMSQLARDRATRAAASREVQQWANTKGVDVSTFGSQYKALNEVVEKNIARFNNTRIAEGEIASTLENLSDAATESGLTPVRAYNAAKLWVKGEFNNPDVQKYAFHLNQLRSELALYNAATQGRSGAAGVLAQDFEEASRVLQQGIAAGSLDGLKTAIERSVEKMGTVLAGSVDRANQDVWNLFGVGDKYKPKVPRKTDADGTLKPGQTVTVGGFTVKVKP